jgi:hypothetical protein
MPNTINPFKQSILDQLGIPATLADNTESIHVGLHRAYKKYKAYLEACRTYDQMMADGTWTGAKLTKVDLIQLFMSRSFYYSHYQKYFSKVANYPILMEWLENDSEERPRDKDVWGANMVKSSYNFADLEKFYKDQGKKGKRQDERAEGSKAVKDNRKKPDEREGGSKVVKDKKKKKQVK